MGQSVRQPTGLQIGVLAEGLHRKGKFRSGKISLLQREQFSPLIVGEVKGHQLAINVWPVAFSRLPVFTALVLIATDS